MNYNSINNNYINFKVKEMWNVSKREDVYHLFDIKDRNICPDGDIIVWRRLTSEDRKMLMRKELELKKDSNNLSEAIREYEEVLLIGDIVKSGIITDNQYNLIELEMEI